MITFLVRGSSLKPYYAADTNYEALGNTAPSSIVDAGAIGGFSLDQGGTGVLAQHRIHYQGIGNWPSTNAFSFLHRFYLYDNTQTCSLFSCVGGGRQGNFGQGAFQIQYNPTNFVVSMSEKFALTGINSVTFAHGGLSNATYYDLFGTFTGDTTASGFELFLDASSLGTTTATRSWDNPRSKVYNSLILGQCSNAPNTYIRTNEFALWNEIKSPTAIVLESGSGSLNGASRTSLVASAQFDGSAVSSAPKNPNLSCFGI